MATIQGVYVALFGRPADPTGLAYFKDITKDGADLSAIGDLAGTAEYKARFEGQSNVQIVNSIYKSLFNRDADVAGLNFFVNALNTGALNINNIAIAILDGAQGADKTVVERKVAAADAFTSALDTAAEIIGYDGAAAAASARAWLAGVKDTAPTAAQIDAAVSAAVGAGTGGGSGTAGVILTLTNGADVFTPTAAADANKTTAGNDTIRGLESGDWASADIIDGGAGTDTLNARFNEDANIAPVLKSVEIVNLTANSGAAPGVRTIAINHNATIDFASATDLQQVNLSAVTLTTGVGAANQGNVTLKGIDKAAVVSLSDINNTAVAGDALVNIEFASATGTNDSASINVNKVASVAAGTQDVNVVVNGIENLAVKATGDASTFVLAANTLKALTVTGDKNLTLSEAVNSTALKTVDASAFSGVLTYTATANGETISGGSKGDIITLGGGADTLVYVSANKSTITNLDKISGFDAGTSTTAVDKINLASFNLGADTKVGNYTTSTTALTADFTGFFTAENRIITQANGADQVTVYVDVDGNGNFNAGTDLAIQLNTVGLGTNVANIDLGDFILA